MGDVKVNDATASVESNEAPVENGTKIPEVPNNTENKEVTENEKGDKEPSESENSISTKMEVDEDSKLSLEDKEEAEEVPSKEIPPVSKRKSRSSRSSSSNSLPSNVSSKQMESEDSKNILSKTKNDVQSENTRVNNSEKDEEDFYGFESPVADDKYNKLIKAMNRLIESLNQVEESDDFMGFDTDTSDIQSKSNDVDSVDSHADGTMNESEYTEGLMAPVSTRKTPRSVKKSVTVDLSNPEFKKPFNYGWIRELVYRSTSDSNIRRNADIYYYTPTGKKVRSSREILEHLSGSDLTLDNFTFFKEPIGMNDPTKEIIREAKTKPGPRGVEDGTPPLKKLTPKVKLTTSSTPSNTSKFSSPKDNVKASLTPKVVFKGNSTKNRMNSGKNKLDKKRKSAGPDDVDIIMETAEWSPDQKINPTRDVCSIECRLAMGLIPTLQCHKCLCLYHPECVGLQKEKLKPNHSYACKNCQVMKSPAPPALPPPVSLPAMASLPPPPPLTPIVPISRGNKSIVVTSSGPPVSTVPSQSATVNSRSGGIVGAVTTWLAPSSSIQVAPQENSVASTDSPQGLVNLNGRPFLFIPKHNVVNVVNSQQSSMEGGEVSNPPSLFLVPCDPPPKQSVMKTGDPSTTQLTNGVKRPLDSQEDESFSPPEKKQKQSHSRKQGSQSPDCVSSHSVSKDDGPNFMQNLNAGFIGLLHTFQYLKVYELLRAACVSRMWNFVASHTSLWETVRMKNSKVRDWNGFGRTLLKHGTRTLDLRKMIVPDTIEEQAHMWEELTQAIKNVKSLTKVDMGRCSPAALSLMAEAAPQLKSLISLAIRANELDLAPFTKLTNLTELKLKAAQNGIELKNFECLKELKNLTSLALTTVKNLDGIEEYLPTGLVSLELGECSTLSPEMATQTLPKLTNLVRLRLEKGQNDCPTIALLNAIAGLPNLVQLELINFDVKPGFDKALSKCTNIQTLLIIPTYVTQSATTNHVVMGGVAKLSHSLNYFIWGLTLELLKVTDLFIGQVENQKGNKPLVPKKGSGDSIPILKPATDGEPKEGGQPSQVDILALPNLQRVLTTLLPQTKIKILKVPFSATWRQTVTDS